MHRTTRSAAGPRRSGLRCAIVALLVLAAPPGRTDTVEDWHTWSAVLATGRLGAADSPWRFWLEGQARFNDDSSRFNQTLLRGAAGRALGPNATVWAGYAFVPTNRPRTADNLAEHRLWQQLTWSTPLAGFTLATRTRLEQREVEGASDTGWRFRQLAKLTHPLGDGGRWYLSAWDELFVHLNDTDWGADGGFDQNRAFVGLGARLGSAASAEVGYLNQRVRRPGRADASNHVLSLTLFLSY